MEANTELHKQQTKHARELAELQAQLERECTEVPVPPLQEVHTAPPALQLDMCTPATPTILEAGTTAVQTADMEPAQALTQEAREILVCARSWAFVDSAHWS